MFRLYDESQHQAFLNNGLKIIKDIKRIIQNNIWYRNKLKIKYFKFISDSFAPFQKSILSFKT